MLEVDASGPLLEGDYGLQVFTNTLPKQTLDLISNRPDPERHLPVYCNVVSHDGQFTRPKRATEPRMPNPLTRRFQKDRLPDPREQLLCVAHEIITAQTCLRRPRSQLPCLPKQAVSLSGKPPHHPVPPRRQSEPGP